MTFCTACVHILIIYLQSKRESGLRYPRSRDKPHRDEWIDVFNYLIASLVCYLLHSNLNPVENKSRQNSGTIHSRQLSPSTNYLPPNHDEK